LREQVDGDDIARQRKAYPLALHETDGNCAGTDSS
jgi:hypothetical protein